MGVGRRWAAMTFAFGLAIVFAGLAGAWQIPILARMDLKVSREFQEIRHPWLDAVMAGATLMGSGVALTVIAFVAAFWLLQTGRRREAMAAAMSSLALVLNIGLKLVANRPRPGNPVEVITETYGSSFPSGHSMGAAAVYGTLAALVWSISGRVWPVVGLVILAVLVGVSRVYLGAHWGYDVLAGWAAGTMCVASIVAWLRAKAVREAGSPEADCLPPTPSHHPTETGSDH